MATEPEIYGKGVAQSEPVGDLQQFKDSIDLRGRAVTVGGLIRHGNRSDLNHPSSGCLNQGTTSVSSGVFLNFLHPFFLVIMILPPWFRL